MMSKKKNSPATSASGKDGNKSAFADLAAKGVHDPFMQRIRLGLHKTQPDWNAKIKRAKKHWAQPDTDKKIGKPHTSPSSLHPDELQAALDWECFRHLYFSGRLSAFWNAMIEEPQMEFLERFRVLHPEAGGHVEYNGFNLHSRKGEFCGPWGAWADDPCFLLYTWEEMRLLPDSLFARQVAPKPATSPVRVMKDWPGSSQSLSRWLAKRVEEQLDQFAENKTAARVMQEVMIPEKIQKGEPSAMEDYRCLTQEVLEIPSAYISGIHSPKSATNVVVEIDWHSTKQELCEAFWKAIEPVYEKKLAKPIAGPRHGIRTLFAGLVMRRRLGRGVKGAKPINEGLYGNSERPQHKTSDEALRKADERLETVRRQLESIELWLGRDPWA